MQLTVDAIVAGATSEARAKELGAKAVTVTYDLTSPKEVAWFRTAWRHLEKVAVAVARGPRRVEIWRTYPERKRKPAMRVIAAT